jgi:hypothetical protein
MLHLRLIILLVGDDVPVDSKSFLVTDLVNLKMKSVKSFRCAYRSRVCVCVHRGEHSYVYEYLRLYCVSQIKKQCKN